MILCPLYRSHHAVVIAADTAGTQTNQQTTCLHMRTDERSSEVLNLQCCSAVIASIFKNEFQTIILRWVKAVSFLIQNKCQK